MFLRCRGEARPECTAAMQYPLAASGCGWNLRPAQSILTVNNVTNAATGRQFLAAATVEKALQPR